MLHFMKLLQQKGRNDKDLAVVLKMQEMAHHLDKKWHISLAKVNQYAILKFRSLWSAKQARVPFCTVILTQKDGRAHVK